MWLGYIGLLDNNLLVGIYFFLNSLCPNMMGIDIQSTSQQGRMTHAACLSH